MHGFKIALEISWLAAAIMLCIHAIIMAGLLLSTNPKEETSSELLSKTKVFIATIVAFVVSAVNAIYFSLAP